MYVLYLRTKKEICGMLKPVSLSPREVQVSRWNVFHLSSFIESETLQSQQLTFVAYYSYLSPSLYTSLFSSQFSFSLSRQFLSTSRDKFLYIYNILVRTNSIAYETRTYKNFENNISMELEVNIVRSNSR